VQTLFSGFFSTIEHFAYFRFFYLLYMPTEKIALLALKSIPGIGDVFAKKIIQQAGSAEAVFNEKPNQLIHLLGGNAAMAKKIKSKSGFDFAEKEMALLTENKGVMHSCFDPDYPERLRHCADSPLYLFGKGNLSWTQRRHISIVGTRNCTPQGVELTKNIIAELASFNPVIVSGFAYGIDIAAHLGAMDQQLETIGVLAHGLNQLYPPSHRKHQAEMEQNGGFLTEFCTYSVPDRDHFVRRNRIVAGMSEATVVIESAARGGSLITAQMANDYSRDVFALPGRTTDAMSAGCHWLIKTQRAQLVTSGAEIAYHLGWIKEELKPKPVQKKLFVQLEPLEQKLFDLLQNDGQQELDLLALSAQLPIHQVSSLLITLELKGMVRPLPGKRFEAI